MESSRSFRCRPCTGLLRKRSLAVTCQPSHFLISRAAPEVEVDTVGAGVAQVGEDARRLGEGRALEHLVQQVVAEVGFGGIAVQPVHEIFPLIVDAGVEIQLGVFRLHRLDARSAAGDETDVQVLEAVVFIIVEAGEEHARARRCGCTSTRRGPRWRSCCSRFRPAPYCRSG